MAAQCIGVIKYYPTVFFVADGFFILPILLALV